MIRAIIFDCFGVLYPDTFWTMADEYLGDSLEAHRSELHELVRRADLGFITRDDLWDEFAHIVGEEKTEVFRRLKEFGGLDNRLLAFIDKNRADYKIGMISNVGHGFLEEMFTSRPVSDYFDDIVLSSDVGLVKPDRAIYELAAERLQLPTNECLFIDDLTTNVDGARLAGMSAIRYTSYSQFLKDVDTLL